LILSSALLSLAAKERSKKPPKYICHMQLTESAFRGGFLKVLQTKIDAREVPNRLSERIGRIVQGK
jgi:hypothetical protein